jgi:hypothetical protein
MVSTSGDAHQTMQVDIIKINYEKKISIRETFFLFFTSGQVWHPFAGAFMQSADLMDRFECERLISMNQI